MGVREMQTNTISSMKREMMRRRYSQRTIDSYLFCIEKFLSKFRKNPRKITKKEIKDYLDDLAERNKAGSTLNINLCSIRFLMEDVLHRNLYLKLKYSKRPKSLPVFMTKEETKRFFSVVENPKHKFMLELMYSAGLRVSELLNLKVRDFESNYGWVRKGKGNKDRMFIIADKLKKNIEDHITNQGLKYNDFLFIGRNGRMHPSSIRYIVKDAAKKAKIRKNVHPHTLRHSFGTHMAEDGCNIIEL
ncbi:unnamed protein product, partial [marine sediment metagenome]